MQETDIEEQIFEITIFTKLKEKNMLEKEDTIIDKLIDKYPKIESEYIILVESWFQMKNFLNGMIITNSHIPIDTTKIQLIKNWN